MRKKNGYNKKSYFVDNSDSLKIGYHEHTLFQAIAWPHLHQYIGGVLFYNKLDI